jgi:tetratricopeptide (TPR) repeat protein
MKLLTCLIITIAITVSLQAQTTAPDFNAEAQAKEELNEAARAYRMGNFADALAHSEKALLLDPQNKTAPYFVARTIHAQYKPGDFTPENIEKARQAIVAYQRIHDRSPGDDEVYKAVAYLYSAIKEDELFRQWILQRAVDTSMANDKRAEAFVVLASRDWDCSFKITQLPANKVTSAGGSNGRFRYKMPKERVEFQRAKECANRALEMANMAITLTPEGVSAWSYKTNILLELEKLAEMLGQVQHKRELHRQYEEALEETTRLSKHSQPNP